MTLKISALLDAYRNRILTPRAVIQTLLKKMEEAPGEIWISKTPFEQLEEYLLTLEEKSPEDLPLYGIPFAVKDNIDLKGMKTTAACPDFAYAPTQSAFVVDRLIRLGAIPLGKTNMDQFATGLVGTRTPYGAIPNKFAPEYISGGSSSGSAAALAYGLCSFSLGTDTAGSGRIPAAFNELVGVKPSRGLLSARGVVPACQSLDCVSIFALDNADARYLLNLTAVEDTEDAYSRAAPWNVGKNAERLPENWTFGVPEDSELNFFGNENFRKTFYKAVEAFEKAGGKKVVISFSPFLEAANLLYEGPWVFERYEAVGKFIETHPDSVHPVTKSIIAPKRTPHPSEVFTGFHTLQKKKKLADRELSKVDFLLTPTAGTIYKTKDVEEDPIRLNSNLGRYTNYMNLLDYAALAIPAGRAPSDDANVVEFPFGVTLVGKAFDDFKLLDAAEKVFPFLESKIAFAVCGAHLKGEPLHDELSNAEFLGCGKTAEEYEMLALLNGKTPKPALLAGGKNAFYVELYAMNASDFGKFVARIPAPLAMGKIKLSDGTVLPGFIGDASLSESGNPDEIRNISAFGDWRKFIHS